MQNTFNLTLLKVLLALKSNQNSLIPHILYNHSTENYNCKSSASVSLIMRMCDSTHYIATGTDKSYLSLERYDLSVHGFEHGVALIDKSGRGGVAGLRAGRHGNEIVVIDVNAVRQAVLVPLLLGAGPAPAGGAAQRSHRARASATSPRQHSNNNPTLIAIYYHHNTCILQGITNKL